MSKTTTLYFEDLTIGDILNYLGFSFCDAKMNYVKFGKNHRAAWQACWENDSHYEALRSNLGTKGEWKGIKEIAKFATKHLNVSEDEFREFLNDNMPEEWAKEDTSKEANDEEFEVIMGLIFKRIEARFRANPQWNLKLAHKKKSK